jgi:hypothetical protein
MLKKSASFVLASLGLSTYRKEVRLDPSLAAASLNGLFDHPVESDRKGVLTPYLSHAGMG